MEKLISKLPNIYWEFGEGRLTVESYKTLFTEKGY